MPPPTDTEPPPTATDVPPTDTQEPIQIQSTLEPGPVP
jgi:hypothetical protein